MKEFFKQWLFAVFTDARVRISFWGLVASVMLVQLPMVPDGTVPQWFKLLMMFVSGVLFPWITEFAKKQSEGK